MKIGIGIIAYNPTSEDIDNIHNHAARGYSVYVYNNTETDYDAYAEKIVSDYSNIFVLGSGSNDGMSIACDEICRVAALSVPHILLLDQDSRFNDIEIKKLINAICLYKDAAIICPQIVYSGEPKCADDYGIVDWCITSGSLINLRYMKDILSFDRNYFIDRVDVDLCKQIKNAGLEIVRVNNSILYQQLGEEVNSSSKSYFSHSPLRCYYMTRNRLYYNKKYGISSFVSYLQTIKHVTLILRFESYDKNKLKMIKRGIFDYYHNKMGKQSL